ncbi:MAG TPA: Hsp20/alpha crystallin family protein [Opitutaceae bacterium]
MSLLNALTSPFQRSAARAESSAGASLESEPTIRPRFEVKETADAFGLVVHLPGVAREDLEITVEDEVIRIIGRRAWKRPESWTSLYRESTDAPYELTLSHDHAINLDQVHAELKDGVLRASLPKTEAIKPRKIAVS